MSVFTSEAEFEEAVISALQQHGWDRQVLKNPTEKDLLDNWAQILYENNRSVDRLGEYPLTEGEMHQILERIAELKTPVNLNGFINGKTVEIKRDNPDDKAHFGKEVSLKIYDRDEIAAGQSRYQIAQQPILRTASDMRHNRRGDLLLLINGMPVIHIELKRSRVSVREATNQIQKYSDEGIFTGIYSLVQIFVGMTPDETLYFANPGSKAKFNRAFHFHWADFNNEPINNWREVVKHLLSIPMAHKMIGYYTIPDSRDGVLKVMRSYQYYAAHRISDRVEKHREWGRGNQLGGYIWHTTGSGKTMTSFKSAQLIAQSRLADKVIFLMDRIELGTQSLAEYRGFAGEDEDVQATENTSVLLAKLLSQDPGNTLIVTSIQKMSRLQEEGGHAGDVHKAAEQRIVFIVDECHRSTFGDMLTTIKKTFPKSLFFGFTGTPIHSENKKKDTTTVMIFGDELHRYSIADGIRDGNVLGFDPYQVSTFHPDAVRQAVALHKAKVSEIGEIEPDSPAEKTYFRYLDKDQVPMAGYRNELGEYTKGIEDELPDSQYNQPLHREQVVSDILGCWHAHTARGKYHAILATSSINEAVEYFRLLRGKKALDGQEIRVTALFDPSIDNTEGAIVKEEALEEVLSAYNSDFGTTFTIPEWQAFKRDVASRLAHKDQHRGVEHRPAEQLHLLIVVDQMLTGFDSKWISTLFLDKMLKYEHLIQAFSRTNRVFGEDKKYGIIRYYRRPYTMYQNIENAMALYSGNRPRDLFADRLYKQVAHMNLIYEEIAELFASEGIADFKELPAQSSAKAKFAQLFKQLNNTYETAKLQGFDWGQDKYPVNDGVVNLAGSDEDAFAAADFTELPDELSGDTELCNEVADRQPVTLTVPENDYLVLALRYKELRDAVEEKEEEETPELEAAFDIDPYLLTIDTELINAEYMNTRFQRWVQELQRGSATQESRDKLLSELQSSFASLPKEEQRFAELFLHDVQTGDVELDEGKTFRDYINDYMRAAENTQMQRVVAALGVDLALLENLAGKSAEEIHSHGRFDALLHTVDKGAAAEFAGKIEGQVLSPLKLNLWVSRVLKTFLESGEFPEPGDKQGSGNA